MIIEFASAARASEQPDIATMSIYSGPEKLFSRPSLTLTLTLFNASMKRFLSSPVASLDAQSVDSRPSCEACLCRAEFA